MRHLPSSNAFQSNATDITSKLICTRLPFASIHTKDVYFSIHSIYPSSIQQNTFHASTQPNTTKICAPINCPCHKQQQQQQPFHGRTQSATKSHNDVGASAHWIAECRYRTHQPVLGHVIQPRPDSCSSNSPMRSSRINRITAFWMRSIAAFRRYYWPAVHLVSESQMLRSHAAQADRVD